MRPVVIIAGPTASGKSTLAVETARIIEGEIVGADSIQIYKGLDIGSAKPSKKEMGGIPHHMIDLADPGEEYSVARFKREAEKTMESISDRDRVPIVAGGTGLYIESLVKNINFEKEDDNSAMVKRFEDLLREKGARHLHCMLCEKDPKAGCKIHQNNTRRVIRYLAILEKHGGTIEDYKKKAVQNPSSWDYRLFILKPDRAFLYGKIEKRIDSMLESGLVEEVEGLLNSGIDRNAQSMQGIGYKETAMYLEGLISQKELERLLKRNTRRYAKRQYTWFSRYPDTTVIPVNETTDISAMASLIAKKFKK